MKKYWPLLLSILFPYTIIFAVICIFSGFLMDTVFENNAFNLIFALLVWYVAALAGSLAVFVVSLARRWNACMLLRMNMLIKLIHAPAYVLIFIAGVLAMGTIFTMGFSIAFVVFDCLSIVLSGLIGLGGVIRARKEGRLGKGAAVACGVLQFVFCADVVCAVVLYAKASSWQAAQN